MPKLQFLGFLGQVAEVSAYALYQQLAFIKTGETQPEIPVLFFPFFVSGSFQAVFTTANGFFLS